MCCRETHNTQFVFSSCFSDCRSRYDNVEKYNREATDVDNIIRRMRFACWKTKATDKYSEYGIFITFHGNFNLHDRTTILRLRTFPAYQCVSCFQNMAENQILF